MRISTVESEKKKKLTEVNREIDRKPVPVQFEILEISKCLLKVKKYKDTYREKD